MGQSLPDSWNLSSDGTMLTAGGVNDQGFYSINDIPNIEFHFEESDWFDIMDDNYDMGTDLLATCWINGERFDSVGIRFKGQTSFRQNDTEKKSFNITLDYMIEDQEIDGYSTINLNCGWGDNTSMREVLYNNIGHYYYMGLKSNYAQLSINGQNWGPYQCIQQFNSSYIKEWYLSNDGTIWRALRIGGGGGGPGGGGGGPNFGAGTSSLNYNGPDSTDYKTDYTLKRTEQDDPWAGLIEACDILENEPLETLEEALSKVLDIDKACWFLAHEIIWADDDSYVHKGGMDYYVYYEAETGRIIPMEYDGNSVMANNHLNWNLFYRENNDDFPLMNRMLAVPSIRQRYLAHVRTILSEYFNAEFCNTHIDQLFEMIDPLIQDDPKRFYTYNQFVNSVNNLKQYILTRRNNLLAHNEMADIEPLEISQIEQSVEGVLWTSPTSEDKVSITVDVTGNADIDRVNLYYGSGLTGVFSKVIMQDDGDQNDGAASDGKYGATIPSHNSGSYVRYYIEAVANDDANTASYLPQGAEHDVYIYQVNFDVLEVSDIVINEFMASNQVTIQDQDGEFDDWIELYNNGDTQVDLTDFHLSDNQESLTKWQFPNGTMIQAKDYLIIWADGDEYQEGLHANFKLSADGESVLLSNDENQLIDIIEYGEQESDFTYGRYPNGTGPFQKLDPTFGSKNMSLTSTFDQFELSQSFSIFPNPTSDKLFLRIDESMDADTELSILNTMGQTILKTQVKDFRHIDVRLWNSGLYIFKLGKSSKIFMVK